MKFKNLVIVVLLISISMNFACAANATKSSTVDTDDRMLMCTEEDWEWARELWVSIGLGKPVALILLFFGATMVCIPVLGLLAIGLCIMANKYEDSKGIIAGLFKFVLVIFLVRVFIAVIDSIVPDISSIAI